MLEDVPHHGDRLNALSSDWARAEYCRKQMEKYRDLWFQGQQEHKEIVAMSGDQRFRYQDGDQRETTGAQRWARTSEAKDYAALEQMWYRWWMGYMERAKFAVRR